MKYKINKYPDGTSYVTVPDYVQDNGFTFRINSYEDLWHLNQLVDAWNNRYGKKPNVFIPNLIDAQADRRFDYDQSSGLKLVCKFLNQMDAVFTINHPHNAEVVEALIDGVIIKDNKEFIDKVLFNISQEKFQNNIHDSLILMSSDAGGFKPLMKLCDKINWKGETASASKSRSYDKDGNTKLNQNLPRIDFGGKDILIIDDISVYGGTFKGLATMLEDCNVGKLYLAVSHMTIQNLGNDPVTNYFTKVYTTNSKFDNYFKKTKDGGIQPTNLNIVKIWK